MLGPGAELVQPSGALLALRTPPVSPAQQTILHIFFTCLVATGYIHSFLFPCSGDFCFILPYCLTESMTLGRSLTSLSCGNQPDGTTPTGKGL